MLSFREKEAPLPSSSSSSLHEITERVVKFISMLQVQDVSESFDVKTGNVSVNLPLEYIMLD